MKVYISVDIEGITGVTSWDEADIAHVDYGPARAQMAAEAHAACLGALEAGATEIVVKDAHATGRNLRPDDLPAPARLLRGWSGHPLCMVQELDETFDAVVLVGWHSAASDGGNPLAHTMSSRTLQEARLDDVRASEFSLHAQVAASLGVPVVFVAGDGRICEEVRDYSAAIGTFAVKTCMGASTLSRHPDEVEVLIRSGVMRALTGDRKACLVEPPALPTLELTYKEQVTAYKKSWYPGAELTSPTKVRFTGDGMFEVMRFLQFAL